MSASPVASPSIIITVAGPTPTSIASPACRWWFAPITPAMYPSPLAAGKVSLAGRHSAQRNYRAWHECGSATLGARLPRTNAGRAAQPQEEMLYTLEYFERSRGRRLERSVRPVSEWTARTPKTKADVHCRRRLPRSTPPPSPEPVAEPTAPHNTPTSVYSVSTNNSPFVAPSLDSAEGKIWGYPLKHFLRRSSPDSSFDVQSCMGDATPGSAISDSSVRGLYCASSSGGDKAGDDFSPVPNPYGTPLSFNPPQAQTKSDRPAELKVSVIPLAPCTTASARLQVQDTNRVPSPRLGSSLGFVVMIQPAQRVSSRLSAFLDAEFDSSS